ncbi:MAG: penicillin-insensitive murein endopeptidase [Rhizobiales bacterium PAR1]|nr:MAG: penicillin-insensitive murein endopeptidase [Rhizobiales bacterium PAR1]
MIVRTLAAALLIGLSTAAHAQQNQTEEMERREKVLAQLPNNAAKRIFGTVPGPANLEARAIGSFAKGCIAGATALPIDGETWQVMRLSRNRNWGHPDLIGLLEKLARRAPKEAGWPGLLVGDISQPRGGPMLTGHASHQIGLDADLWLTPMPGRRLSRDERENMSATNIVRPDWMDVEPSHYSAKHLALIRLAAREKAVTRIFVNPAIKVALCRDAGADRGWLSKVRPMWGHNYHFHIRIACPAGEASCVDQPLPQDEDGCGSELKDWLKKQYAAMHKPKPQGNGQGKPKPPPKPWTLDDLPDECRQVAVSK